MSETEHKRLLTVLRTLPEDYAPWGEVERWADPERAYPDCSSGCRFARWLEDVQREDGSWDHLSLDWCVCTNPASHRVGLLTFEHQGCQHFVPEDEEATTDDGGCRHL